VKFIVSCCGASSARINQSTTAAVAWRLTWAWAWAGAGPVKRRPHSPQWRCKKKKSAFLTHSHQPLEPESVTRAAPTASACAELSTGRIRSNITVIVIGNRPPAIYHSHRPDRACPATKAKAVAQHLGRVLLARRLPPRDYIIYYICIYYKGQYSRNTRRMGVDYHTYSYYVLCILCIKKYIKY